MSDVIVQKYGGSSVATPEKIVSIAEKIEIRVTTGEKVVVVVSAMGKSTDELIGLARRISDRPHPREMDMLLSTGEQVSAALLSMALNDRGIPSVSYNAFQLRMLTTGHYCDARIMDLNFDSLKKELERNDVVVVTGFQGINAAGEVTTLGRGGSDTSAVAIAAKAGISCEIYSDVDGIYTCDPRLVSNARKLAYITYDEMLELAAQGAGVLHSRAVEIAKRYGVDIYCASTFSEKRGTHVMNALPEWLEQPVVTGVTTDPDQMKITINHIPNEVDLLGSIFSALAERRVNVDMITTVSEGKYTYLNFTTIACDIHIVREILEDVLNNISGWSISENEDVSKVSVVGVGMRSSPGVAARFFSALGRKNVGILGTTTSEIKISVLVPSSQEGTAVSELVDEFDLTE